jgi:hypothetical protein
MEADVAFDEARAEANLASATHATDPGLARVHFALAGLYLRRALAAREAETQASDTGGLQMPRLAREPNPK